MRDGSCGDEHRADQHGQSDDSHARMLAAEWPRRDLLRQSRVNDGFAAPRQFTGG
jgi:hypothetical protein